MIVTGTIRESLAVSQQWTCVFLNSHTIFAQFCIVTLKSSQRHSEKKALHFFGASLQSSIVCIDYRLRPLDSWAVVQENASNLLESAATDDCTVIRS